VDAVITFGPPQVCKSWWLY